jgi:hypothetical protein
VDKRNAKIAKAQALEDAKVARAKKQTEDAAAQERAAARKAKMESAKEKEKEEKVAKKVAKKKRGDEFEDNPLDEEEEWVHPMYR